MRITYLTHFPGPGGSTNLMLQLREYFRAKGHETSVVTSFDSDRPLFNDYVHAGLAGIKGWRERIRRHLEAVRSTRPDAVHTISGGNEFDLLRFLSVPRVLHVSSLESHFFVDMPLWLRQLGPFTEARTANTPDVLQTITPRPPHRAELRLAPYQVSPEFLNLPDTPANPRPDAEPIEVCFVGRLENVQKRVDWLPNIIRRTRVLGSPFEWHLYGEGPSEPELRRRLAANGDADRVHFHGWLRAEELARSLSKHDLFFLCSRWEGLPIAMAEAMLAGLACVVPRVDAGMTYILRDGGGWTYEAHSVESCALALVKATLDRRLLQQRKIEAQRITRAMYDPAVVESQMADIEAAVARLQFNGNVLDPASAPGFREVRPSVRFRRRCYFLWQRIWKNRR